MCATTIFHDVLEESEPSNSPRMLAVKGRLERVVSGVRGRSFGLPGPLVYRLHFSLCPALTWLDALESRVALDSRLRSPSVLPSLQDLPSLSEGAPRFQGGQKPTCRDFTEE